MLVDKAARETTTVLQTILLPRPSFNFNSFVIDKYGIYIFELILKKNNK